MKCLIATALIAASSASYAQRLQVNVPCYTPEQIAEMFIEFEELPFARAFVDRIVDGKQVQMRLAIFANPDTKSYTVLEENGDMLCIIASGDSLEGSTKAERDQVAKGFR